MMNIVYWFNIDKTRKNLFENSQKKNKQLIGIKEIQYF